VEGRKKILVGYDLCNEYAQISCYSYKTYEPVSISDKDGSGIIPNVLYLNSNNAWSYGVDAIKESQEEDGTVINDIFGKINSGKVYKYRNESVTGIDLLEKFLRRTLSIVKKHFPNDLISNLVITTKTMDKSLVNALYEALERIGILKDRAKVISHSESYVYYALNMGKELWVNDVALFDFSKSSFTYYQISINRRIKPMIAGIIKKDFSNVLDYSMINENIVYAFENILNRAMYKQIISTVYFTGEGFIGEWANESIKDLCQGRRVFIGQNMYSKGACYAAKEDSGDTSLHDYIILSSEMITSTISIMVYDKSKYKEIQLIGKPMLWQDVDESLEIILDNQREIEFTIRNIMTKDFNKINLILDVLPERPNKMTRILIKAICPKEDRVNIEVVDLGFGEFYPSSGKTWKLTVDLM